MKFDGTLQRGPQEIENPSSYGCKVVWESYKRQNIEKNEINILY